MTQKYLATWPESPKRVRKKILTHAKDTPRSHTKLLSSPSRDLASLGIIPLGCGKSARISCRAAAGSGYIRRRLRANCIQVILS